MTLQPTDLPPVAAAAFHDLTEEQKAAFVSAYEAKRRSMPLMMAFAILLPIQLFLLGKVLLGILFLLTGGGLGVWYLIEWFMTPQRVRDYNTKVAGETMTLVKAGSDTAAAIAEPEED
ncbi:MAG TPA: hypothetical protein VFZ80_06300 [Acidimicrobiia bacterium]